MASAGLQFRSVHSPLKLWYWLPFTQLLCQSFSQLRLSQPRATTGRTSSQLLVCLWRRCRQSSIQVDTPNEILVSRIRAVHEAFTGVRGNEQNSSNNVTLSCVIVGPIKKSAVW